MSTMGQRVRWAHLVANGRTFPVSHARRGDAPLCRGNFRDRTWADDPDGTLPRCQSCLTILTTEAAPAATTRNRAPANGMSTTREWLAQLAARGITYQETTC